MLLISPFDGMQPRLPRSRTPDNNAPWIRTVAENVEVATVIVAIFQVRAVQIRGFRSHVVILAKAELAFFRLAMGRLTS